MPPFTGGGGGGTVAAGTEVAGAAGATASVGSDLLGGWGVGLTCGRKSCEAPDSSLAPCMARRIAREAKSAAIGEGPRCCVLDVRRPDSACPRILARHSILPVLRILSSWNTRCRMRDNSVTRETRGWRVPWPTIKHALGADAWPFAPGGDGRGHGPRRSQCTDTGGAGLAMFPNRRKRSRDCSD
jgi:hypothetical protein